jgi:hypothetical protein
MCTLFTRTKKFLLDCVQVWEPDTFAGPNVPNIAPVCAANIHRQKNGGSERTYDALDWTLCLRDFSVSQLERI